MAKKGIFKKIIAGITATALVGAGAVGVGCIANDDFKDKVFTTLNISQEEPKKESSAASNETIKIKELQTQLEANLEELESTKAELETTKTELETTKATNQAEISELENQLIAKNQELESTKTQLSEKVSEYEVLSSEKAELQEQLEIANANITSLQSELDTVNANLEDANADIETLTARKTELEAELQTEQNNVSTLNAQLETANLDIENKASEIILLNENVSTLTTDKENLQGELNLKQTEIDNLNSEITILNAKIKEYEDALNEYDPSREYYSQLLLGGDISYFTMSNNDILINSVDRENPGLYLIQASDYSITKILDDAYAYNFKNFAETPSGKVLLSTSNYIYAFQMADSSLTKLADGEYEYFHILSDNNVIISGRLNQYDNYLLLFDDSTNTAELFTDTSSNWIAGQIYSCQMSNLDYIFFTSSSSDIYRYHYDTKTISKFYTHDSLSTSLDNIISLSNGDFIFAYNNGKGLYLLKSDFTFIVLDKETYSAPRVFVEFNNYVLISSKSSYSKYLLLLNLSDNSITKISDVGYKWSSVCEIDNKNILLYSENSGYYKLNVETKEILIAENNIETMYATKYITNSGIVILNIANSIYTYNKTTNSLILADNYIVSGAINVIEANNGKVLISSQTNANGILVFDPTTSTFTKPYTTGYGFKFVHVLDDNNIIFATSGVIKNFQIIIYKNDTNEFVQISTDTTLYGLDGIEYQEDGVLLTSSYYGTSAFYDYATQTITKLES